MPMYHPNKTEASNAFTDLIRAVLRMSAHAERIGTLLTRDLGLSNARWITLGVLQATTERLTVSQLARHMGLSRQAVQRLVDEMAADGVVELVVNPADQRAKLVLMTAKGRELHQGAMEREWAWTNTIAEGFDPARLADAALIVDELTKKMEATPPR